MLLSGMHDAMNRVTLSEMHGSVDASYRHICMVLCVGIDPAACSQQDIWTFFGQSI